MSEDTKIDPERIDPLDGDLGNEGIMGISEVDAVFDAHGNELIGERASRSDLGNSSFFGPDECKTQSRMNRDHRSSSIPKRMPDRKFGGRASAVGGSEVRSVGIGIECFTADTRIATSSGEVRAADLSVGDLVQTLDNGLQPIRWIGRRELDANDLAFCPDLRPIRIRAGALGPNMPVRDLEVSPQHRLMISGRSVPEWKLRATEVLVTARQLLDLDGIDEITETVDVEYIHILCDRHEIVFADGARTETLWLGPHVRQTLSPEGLAEIANLFPELFTKEPAVNLDPARPLVPGRTARSRGRQASMQAELTPTTMKKRA